MRRARSRYNILAFCICFYLLSAVILPADSTQQRFEAAVDKIIGEYSNTKTQWGVAIRRDGGQSLYEKKSLRMLVPASNRKLFTSVLAMHAMGPNYRYRTTISAGGEVTERGHLRGDLVLTGSGDPTFGNPDFNAGSITGTLEEWADHIAASGIRFIHRDIAIDCSAFTPDYFAVTELPDDYVVSYAARASGFPIYKNCIAVRMEPASQQGLPAKISLYPEEAGIPLNNQSTTGSKNSANTLRITRPQDSDLITVEGSIPLGAGSEARLITLRSPPKVAGRIMQSYLAQRGVIVRGDVKVYYQDQKPQGPLLGSYESPPLTDILRRVNQPSDNFCAEQVYQSISRRVKGLGSYNNTREIELEFLDQIGINPKYVEPEDGSGLSRADKCTADSIVRLLTWASGQEWFEEYKSTLAVSGRSGTLRRRLGGKNLYGRIYGKTGTLNRVSCISGFYITPNGTRYIFSILINDINTSSGIAAQNKILETLVKYYSGT